MMGRSIRCTRRIIVCWPYTWSFTTYLPLSAPILVPHPNATNAFDGYWEAIHVKQQYAYDESDVLLTAYRCDIGSPFGEFFYS